MSPSPLLPPWRSRRFLSGSSLALIFGLSACNVGPDYERPPLDHPDFFRGAHAIDPSANTREADEIAFADLKWFEVFEDEVLQDLIRTAIGQNFDVLIAVERILAARAAVTIVGADAYPQVSANAAGEVSNLSRNRSTGTIPGADDPNTDVALSGDLAWEIDFWGKVRRASEAARAQLLATEMSRRAVVQSLVSDLAQAYFELRELDLELEITHQSRKSRSRSLELVQARLDGGVANRVEVFQAQVLVTTAAQLIPDIERRIRQKENQIRLLLGDYPGAVARGRSLREQESPIAIPVGLPSQILERRPDLVFAEQSLIAANARIGAAKALLYPSISLTAAGGLQSEDLKDLTKSGSSFWALLPSISLPIFQAGRLRANVDLSEAEQRAAALSYASIVRRAFAEVSDALIGVDRRRVFRAEAQSLAETLSMQKDLSAKRYQGGVTSYLEVLDTERQQLDAELGLAQAVRDELLAVVELYRALGGGWQDSAPVLPES